MAFTSDCWFHCFVLSSVVASLFPWLANKLNSRVHAGRSGIIHHFRPQLGILELCSLDKGRCLLYMMDSEPPPAKQEVL